MASPIPTGKQPVNLASGPSGARVSRIRRDPPPPVKKQAIVDPEEREQWAVVVGVLTFALAIFVIIVALGSYTGRSAKGYAVEVTVAD